MLKELWDNMGSFSQGLHQAVWNVLQNLARVTSGKSRESRGDWKRYRDRPPLRKFPFRGETTNAEQHLSEIVSLLDLKERSCSDRASVINPTQEMHADSPISSRTQQEYCALLRLTLMKSLTERWR